MNVFILLAALAQGTFAQNIILGSGSRLWLEGDSTLHTFSAKAERIDASFALAPEAAKLGLERTIRAGSVARLSVKIPVDGLKSGESGLDKNLRKALSADRFPEIVFAMSGYRVDGDSAAIDGQLSIAGVEKKESLSAAMRADRGRVAFDGEQPLLMTDFGVKPPVFMMGALKTKDRVVVKFHIELEQAPDKTTK